MKVWPFLLSVGKLVVSALVALLLWWALTNSPLWPGHVAAAVKGGNTEALKIDATAKEHEKEQKNALHHVLDTTHWEFFDHWDWEFFDSILPHAVDLKQLGYIDVFGKHFYLTKFMVLEVIAALLIIAIYVPLAGRVQNGAIPRGSWANFFEVLLTFVRDQIAKPGLGEHDADKHAPFLWTLFLFILFNNLLGMVPMLGSATASIFVTGALALWVFFYMHGFGVGKFGAHQYLLSLWPHIEVPRGMGFIIKLVIFLIEWMGVLVRNAVLAVRLFANMFAGHMVMATFLIFIWMARNAPTGLWGTVALSSVAGIVALSLLELFVAFLQAYIFTFLTALFMGMALHPEH
jgi:F-type H+-transporting ATPase subunit a